MTITTLVLPMMLAQSAFSMATLPNSDKAQDVGYEELASGQPQAAIEAIEGNSSLGNGDPAALINLGNAYARLGQTARAADYYRAAIESKDRYDLELADGNWMDSRKAARLALRALTASTGYASRD